jgi:hypothetical protein
MITRDQAIQAAHESIKGRLDISLQDLTRELADSEVLPVLVNDNLAGAVVITGPEVHACILPWACGRWFSKRWLRVFDGLLQEHGEVVTSCSTAMGEDFVKRLGFERMGAYWVKYGS